MDKQNYFSREEMQAILDTRTPGTDGKKLIDSMVAKGAVIQDINDTPTQAKNTIKEGLKTVQAGAAGAAKGMAGIVLTGIDKAGRSIVENLPEDSGYFKALGVTKQEALNNLAQAPSLGEQFKQDFGGNEYPVAFGTGEVAGNIASLAVPSAQVGKLAGAATKIAGEVANVPKVGGVVSKIVKPVAEASAFTLGQSAQSGEAATSKDYLVNSALNLVFPVAGMVSKGLAENVAPRAINSLIKPVQKDFAFGKNPGRTVSELGITANSWEDLTKNITNAKEKIGEAIGSVVKKSQNLQQMDLNQTLSSIDEAIKKANLTPRINASLIQRLEEVKDDLADNINSGINPQKFKKVVGDLTRWTGNISDDTIVNNALKGVYASTRKSMDDVLSKELPASEFAAYKKNAERYGDLMSAENAAINREKIIERSDMLSFGAKNSGVLAALGTAIVSGGSALPTILAGLGVAGIEKAMATPAFKTRLAALLAKLPKGEVDTFFSKVTGAKDLFSEQEIKSFAGDIKREVKSGNLGGFVKIPENKITFSKTKLPQDVQTQFNKAVTKISNSKLLANDVQRAEMLDLVNILKSKSADIDANIVKKAQELLNDLKDTYNLPKEVVDSIQNPADIGKVLQTILDKPRK